jgi:glycosyltransferase involved in cell wall biosynthesis
MIKHYILPVPYALDKYFYIAKEYKNKGRIPIIVTQDIFNRDTERSKKYNCKIIIIKGNSFNRFKKISKLIINEKPKYIDIYDYTIFTLAYIILARILKIKITIFIIGSELKWRDKDNEGKLALKHLLIKFIKTPFTWLSLVFANFIVIKEYHQYFSVSKYRPLKNKIIFLPNSIPVNRNQNIQNNRDIDFLYFNAILKSRHVDDILKACKILDNFNISYNCNIVGFYSLSANTSISIRDYKAEANVIELFKKLNLINVRIEPFSDNAIHYFTRAKYFLFPAETVFLNYSLLEAMSFGVIPIVYNGEGANKIIINGVNGFIIEPGIKNLYAIMNYVLNIKEAKYYKISMAAYKTILNEFSIESWANRLDKFRKIGNKEFS